MATFRRDGGHAEAENKVDALKRKYRPHRNGDANEQSPLPAPRLLGGEDDQQGRVSLRTMVAVALPSMLETMLSNVGLLWISSSVYQMAKGSIIIFSAFFSVRLTDKKLYGYHYASIWIVMLAVIIVEEHMMLALNVSPILLVGLERLWGLVFYVILVPILTLTPATGPAFATTWHEDFVDSFVQVMNSPTLMVLILACIAAVGTLNVTGDYVTKHFSVVLRSIAEVWSLSTADVHRNGAARLVFCLTNTLALLLFVYYVVQWQGLASLGEQWTTYSWLELMGFLLMVYGTLAQLLHLPPAKLYAAEQRELRCGRGDAVKSPFMGNMRK
ncbi:hypothetical protein PHYPSEUDO_005914 [Phytophthora pseudosyringae]|uniref:Transmembrane protein n=1 Tax=Phytophthora pseudosyringae TaxID=221518 RepID=A0A8T1VQ72_9STRA|nr:hypothetical protein PHYPSEUDO_005914 [Phytophthora pseudosyringae]